MKRKNLLFKTLLVAAGLFVGASAWAQISTWTAASGTYTSGQQITGSTPGVITMTLGNDNGWVFDTNRNALVTRTQQTPTLTDGIPTAGGYVVITPARTLNLKLMTYSSQSNCNVYLYEGTNKLKDFRQKAYNENDYGTLEAGKTYYIYGGSFKAAGNATNLEYVFFQKFTATTFENYTIHYKDNHGTTIKDDVVYSGLYGASVTASEEDMASIEFNGNSYGYKSGNQTITLSTGTNEITLIYETAEVCNYTIKYVDNSNPAVEIKDAASVESYVGAEVTASGDYLPTYITYNETKYKYASGNRTLTVTGKAETDVITLVYTPAEVFSYTVKAVDGSSNELATLASGSYTEGDAAIKFAQPRWVLSGTTLYSCGTGTVTYSTTFTPDANDFVKAITYNSGTVNDVIFYTEGEDVEGVSVGTNDARASKGKMGHTGGKETYKDAATLAPGKYIIYMRAQNGNSTSRAFNFKVGDDVVFTGSFANGTNSDANSDEFIVNEASTLSFASEGSSASGIDYFYIVKTSGDIVTFTLGADNDVSYKSYIPTKAVDFTTLEGVKAYVVTDYEDGMMTLTAVDAVPAGTPVLLKGTKGKSVEMVAATGTVAAPEKNYLKATPSDGITMTRDDSNKYVLSFHNGDWSFCHFEGKLPAGKVYVELPESAGARPANVGIRFAGEETTGIADVQRSAAAQNWYNLNGQQVAQPTKGLYIVNGKKVIMK